MPETPAFEALGKGWDSRPAGRAGRTERLNHLRSPLSADVAQHSSVAPTSAPKRPLRVGLLVDSLEVPSWIAAICADAIASDAAEIAAVVTNTPANGHGRPAPSYWPRPSVAGLADLYLYFDDRYFQIARDAMEPVKLVTELGQLPIIESTPIFEEGRFRFSDGDKRRLQECDLDVLLMFWSGLPSDQVLPLARHGVWFFLDHERLFTGQTPLGFWEVLTQQPVTVQYLQARIATSSQTLVLHEYYGRTNARSIKVSRNDLLWKSAAFVTRKLNELHRVDSLEQLMNVQVRSEAPIARNAASNLSVVKPIAAHVTRSLYSRLLRELHFEQWTIGFSFSPTPDSVDREFGKFDWLVPPKGSYWADPFPVQVGDQDYLLFEEFVHAENKGYLRVAAIGPEGLQETPRTLLRQEYHLSYPFVFTWQGQQYMIPETQEANRIDVYKFDAFPYTVSYYTTLMDGITAADTTLIEVDGGWWMFVAIATPGTRNFDELFLYYADNPFGPWVPHPRNPIKSDVRSARPAGRIFARQGRHYRPAQDCSRRYGYAMRLQEIKVLSETDYAEEEAQVILPDWSSDVLATHTFNFSGTLTVIDAEWRRRR
jgi:hypothetical protein